MLTICASIWFLFMILFAGYEWTSAGGRYQKIASARDRIVHAFIGLVIVVGAWSLTAVVGQFFGLIHLSIREHLLQTYKYTNLMITHLLAQIVNPVLPTGLGGTKISTSQDQGGSRSAVWSVGLSARCLSPAFFSRSSF